MLASAHAESVPNLPQFTLSRVFTEWGVDPLLTVLTVVVAGLYLFGVHTMHARGDHWPASRTINFVVVGLGTFSCATASGVAVYDTTLLRVHMVQHMLLSLVGTTLRCTRSSCTR